jgi:hypothetical protein
MKKQAFIIGIVGFFLIVQPMNSQTWEVTKRLTWTAFDSEYPAIAVDSVNTIHVLWNDYSKDLNNEIFYKQSTDGGTTWSKYKRLTWNSGDSQLPGVAVDSSNNIHVVWEDNSKISDAEVFYKASTDSGATWSSHKRLTWNLEDSRWPEIAVDSSNSIHVVWSDESKNSNWEINYKKSNDGGTTWTTRRLTWNSGGSYFPAIAIDTNNHLHVTWYDDSPGNNEIYYLRSTDGGTSWSKLYRLTWSTYSVSASPQITTNSSNHIHVVWHDDCAGNKEIYFKKSTNGGITWEGTKRLTWNSGVSWYSNIAADSLNNIHVVWMDNSKDSNYEIFYKRSTNGGMTWSSYKRLTWTSTGFSGSPCLDTDSNNWIHVVWYDGLSGYAEIYYKRGIQ